MIPNLFNRKTKAKSNLLLSIMLSFFWGVPYTLPAQNCQPSYTIGASTLDLPCVDWLTDSTSASQVYQAQLQLVNAEEFLFQWLSTSLITNPSTETGAIYFNQILHIPKINVNTAPGIVQPYQITMQEEAGVLRISAVKPLSVTGNHRPEATSISRQADLTQTYQQIQLSGNDLDGDTLAYELLAPTSDTGYTLAYLDPVSQKLYVRIDPTFDGTIKLSYRVSDGKTFSEPATVKLIVNNSSANTGTDTGTNTETYFLGSQSIDTRTYAGFNVKVPTSRGSAGVVTAQSIPSSVDLSDSFPTPGNQGQQNSCIGWAVGYAVKSYQEKVEMGWALGQEATDDHLFSPAFIYNQLNGGQDNGLKINDALTLAVDTGVATLATMPYYEFDIQTQPKTQALEEADHYKAYSWATIKSVEDIKYALAKKLPVMITMAAFKSFITLQGSNSIYNTADTYLGEHAVVIVGYNDDFAGGAFKVMNSYGTDWGDNGFFWLPYSFLSTTVTINGTENGTLLSGAYVLLDQENTNVETTTLVADDSLADLPNLKIISWQADYDPVPGGQGVLQYKIMNSGVETIAADTAEVSLVLSESSSLKYMYDDYYEVAEETIPVELATGQAVTRDETTMLSFTIPSVPSGDYYLHLLVDPYDDIEESDESDNFSAGTDKITIVNDLPDLEVYYWYVDLDYQTGKGWLEYVITNEGSQPAEAPWEISLKWHRIDPPSPYTEIEEGMSLKEIDERLGRVKIWDYEVTETLDPLAANADPVDQGFPFVVTSDNAISFNFMKDVEGKDIPTALYELIFTLDSSGKVVQSSQANDVSFSGETYQFETPIAQTPSTDLITLPPDPNLDPNATTSYSQSTQPPPPPDDTTNQDPAPTGGTQDPAPQPTSTQDPAPQPTSTQPSPQTRAKTRYCTNCGTTQTKAFYNGKTLERVTANKKKRSRQIHQPIFSKRTRSLDQAIFPIDKMIVMPKDN